MKMAGERPMDVPVKRELGESTSGGREKRGAQSEASTDFLFLHFAPTVFL